MKSHFNTHTLDFKIPAGTSRGVYRKHHVFYLTVEKEGVTGIGEIAPLPGLSTDKIEEIPTQLEVLIHALESFNEVTFDSIEAFLNQHVSPKFPAVRFGVETALIDLLHGGKRLLFDNDFAHGRREIPINGLIWMGEKDFMQEQIRERISKGFTCIKMKVGALDFDTECSVLSELRQRYGNLVELRLDANGAFLPEEALAKLQVLSAFNIHSIEQPIAPCQEDEMARLCRESPVPIALDEELIRIPSPDKASLLDHIKPQYIILKPTLLGGFSATREWVEHAEHRNIPWWMTSALESNIGLNAICQFAASFTNALPQGLGTGSLYTNNIPSPLEVQGEAIRYNLEKSWDLSQLQ